jgi:hypothetical protein
MMRAVTMKMIRSTRQMSTSGVTLMPETIPSSSSLLLDAAAISLLLDRSFGFSASWTRSLFFAVLSFSAPRARRLGLGGSGARYGPESASLP